MPDTLTVGNVNTVSLVNLTNEDTDTPVTTATVTHTLYTADDVLVAGELDRAAPNVGGATYAAVIPETAPLEAGRSYTGVWSAVIGGNTIVFRASYTAVANIAA